MNLMSSFKTIEVLTSSQIIKLKGGNTTIPPTNPIDPNGPCEGNALVVEPWDKRAPRPGRPK